MRVRKKCWRHVGTLLARSTHPVVSGLSDSWRQRGEYSRNTPISRTEQKSFKITFYCINMIGLQYKKILKGGNVSKSIFSILQLISFGFPLISSGWLSGAPGACCLLTKKTKGNPMEITCKSWKIDFETFPPLRIFLYCNPNMFIL